MKHFSRAYTYIASAIACSVATNAIMTCSAHAQRFDSAAIAITCESYEVDPSSKHPVALLDGYLIPGEWQRGQWHRASTSSISTDHPTFQARGAGTLLVKGETFETSLILSTSFDSSEAHSLLAPHRKELTLKARQFALFSKAPSELTLVHHGAALTLICFTRPALGNKSRTHDVRITKTTAPPAKATPTATPSPSPSFCNTNHPSGVAYCPPNWVNRTKKGWSFAPSTDNSVKPGTICSTKSVADANQMAIAEANARAAGSLNCWAKVCNCSITPNATCPPGQRNLTNPPTCQSLDCFYSKKSQDDARQMCEAEARQISLCRDYQPLCYAAPPPKAETPAKAGTPGAT